MADQPRGPHVRRLVDHHRDEWQRDIVARVEKAAQIRAAVVHLEAWATALETGDQEAAVAALKAVHPFCAGVVQAISIANALVRREQRHDAGGN